MGIRLYDSAWVRLRGEDEPQYVSKDSANPALFRIAGYAYDIDARAYFFSEAVPEVIELLSLQSARELGLFPQYQQNGKF